MSRIMRIMPAAAVGAAAFTVFSAAATAFYPPVGVGGAGVQTVPPTTAKVTSSVVPPVSPPTTAKVTTKATSCVSSPPVTPSGVPEPTTMALGAIGLAGLGAAGLRKRFKQA